MNREHPQDECELDFDTLAESCELECKLAQGAEGKGQLPKDFWSTYSGMANARGGIVLLGVSENKGQFSVAGIENVEKVKQELFSQLNNPAKVSINLLTEDDVVTLLKRASRYCVLTSQPQPESKSRSLSTITCTQGPTGGCMTVTGRAIKKLLSGWWPNSSKMNGTPEFSKDSHLMIWIWIASAPIGISFPQLSQGTLGWTSHLSTWLETTGWRKD